ncbi:copper-containing nitrite reductase [Gellertiella hungarica]|uniref:Copper-containing nitrite reductase n=1 Tax=Gellertiella hungarica TaxID=1572859 RepID=A0A7W6J9I9_9HYPH|nr:copper-containing nitrite reductase [Gellertiella hungarica]MBB4067257.1 nitrite reductase (NO-forming) [Gellertiella hungarica]
MTRTNFGLLNALTILAVCALGAPAFANGSHQHPAANGTPNAPLDVVRQATDLPPSEERSGNRTIKVMLDTVEVTGRLADGATYQYWTFNRKVPGPFIRARVGDRVDVELMNMKDSSERHSVDFHAATGPGGGVVATDAAPGETKTFSFQATKPGLYVYYCEVPMAAHHIANGMYGLILVEPETGMPPVDREFYVMQGEIYTSKPFGTKGNQVESVEKLLDERPEYYVFNGAANALTGTNALTAKVGEKVRIYFGVGGPNKTSSFHVIGEVFDRVYQLGSLDSPPLTDVQTVTVPPGGATVVDLTMDVPGEYTLVDHALSRAALAWSQSLSFWEKRNLPDRKG